jgi:hypothetical protein
MSTIQALSTERQPGSSVKKNAALVVSAARRTWIDTATLCTAAAAPTSSAADAARLRQEKTTTTDMSGSAGCPPSPRFAAAVDAKQSALRTTSNTPAVGDGDTTVYDQHSTEHTKLQESKTCSFSKVSCAMNGPPSLSLSQILPYVVNRLPVGLCLLVLCFLATNSISAGELVAKKHRPTGIIL